MLVWLVPHIGRFYPTVKAPSPPPPFRKRSGSGPFSLAY
jgi:hypothetical protein